MLVFYRAVLESLVRFGITIWFGNLSVQLRSKLLRLVQTAGKIIGVSQLPSLQSIYEQATLKQAQRIVCDVTHVLNGEFVLLPSGRRYTEPKWKYIRFKKSFVPASTKMLNDALKQQRSWGYTFHITCALCNVVFLCILLSCFVLCVAVAGVKAQDTFPSWTIKFTLTLTLSVYGKVFDNEFSDIFWKRVVWTWSQCGR